MKLECDIVKDLLPLYVEQLTSEKSNLLIEEHLKECVDCKKLYYEMKAPEPQIQYSREPAESLAKYVKKKKRILALKAAVITALAILVFVVIRLAIIGSLIAFLALDGAKATVQEDTDVSHYLWYMGENAKKEYVHKWGMDESIFPGKITDKMNVLDYKMVYYDPWDAQYLSYLVADYDEEQYKAETERLKSYASTEYLGYFGAEGFMEKYTLLAIEGDPDFGLIYALATNDSQIIYVELIFCNYFMDIDYQTMIPNEYLPIGFDATVDNLYRQQRLNRN